jgi:hypothetical protein
MMFGKDPKAQAATDMLVAYGITILIISITIYVVLQLGVFNDKIAPTYCNAAPSFTCSGTVLYPNGTLIVTLAQATGGTLNITGAACSNQENATINGPKYGNIFVYPPSYEPQDYPGNSLINNGLIVYSSQQTSIAMYCYGAAGNIATGPLGNNFVGIVWINYTINTLPGNYSTVQRFATFSTKYT